MSIAGDSQQSIPPVGRLILASASPRRQQLLRDAGYDFAVFPANIDEEGSVPNLLPIELSKYLSFEKAKVVVERFPQDVVLAADTVVAFGDKSVGKPADAAAARRMLALLAGTTHIVITGVTIIRPGSVPKTRAVMSAVKMRGLSSEEIEAYVATGQWEGKAGGYGIQDNDPFVMRMSGSLTNIVGLPMEATVQMLTEAGIMPHGTEM